MVIHSRYIGKAKKKVVLFPEIGRVKIFISLTRPHSRMCMAIYIFNFKKQTNKQKKKREYKKSKKKKTTKEANEEKRIFPKYPLILFKDFAPANVQTKGQ